jgi:murein DD-endopeptidase MepM/ murein hydrolase activator NlpD
MATYTVKKGDTLYDIAKQHGTTYQEIAKSNGISNPNLIHPGQTLNIGGNATSEPPAQQNNASPPAATGTTGGTPAPAQNDGFSSADYTPSDAVTQAQALLQQQMASKPGEYQSAWQGQLSDKISEILNRDKFSYDLNADALYQQYADKFVQQGKMASMDTMGQAQAMTGGYGNSWAQSVAHQAYQQSLQQLNDIVPELYGMALDQYNQEGQALYDQAALMAQMEDQDYGRYMDAVNAWNAERDYLTGRYDSERDYDYGKYADDRNFSYGSFVDDRNYRYQQEQDALAETWRQKEFAEAQRQYDEQMALTKEQWAWEQKQAELAASSGGSGGNGGGSGGSGEEGDDFTKAIFSRVDANGNYVFYFDGKERTYAPGVNPYTGTKNSDTKYGTFSNGYQPNNVGGKKLTKSGITDVVNGVTQNVWKTPDGKLWIWDGTRNSYLEYDDGSQVQPPRKSSGGGGGGKNRNMLN